jgi:hypothetical protein
MAKKISLEVLKETRPEKELTSDSEAASEGDGISLKCLLGSTFTQHFLCRF